MRGNIQWHKVALYAGLPLVPLSARVAIGPGPLPMAAAVGLFVTVIWVTTFVVMDGAILSRPQSRSDWAADVLARPRWFDGVSQLRLLVPSFVIAWFFHAYDPVERMLHVLGFAAAVTVPILIGIGFGVGAFQRRQARRILQGAMSGA